MRTRSPMSKTKMSSPALVAAASITSWTASGMVMKYRVTSGWVKVTGPPFSICRRKSGMTLPLLSSTFPKRVMTHFMRPPSPMLRTASSAMRFDAPMTLVGLTALSVLTSTKVWAPDSCAHCRVFFVPTTLVRHASSGWSSITGTCL